MARTAVLVDGGFYLHRAKAIKGNTSPRARAHELYSYITKHITHKGSKKVEYEDRSLYRIFYYDCPPATKGAVKQPWSPRNTVFSKKHPQNIWRTKFQTELSAMRKVAMRMGEIRTKNMHYTLKKESLKRLLSGQISVEELGERDFVLTGMKQAGVDMRLGLDVASLASKRIVDQIILIAGDIDFVPVAKMARRSGIDFLIDPLGNHLPSELIQHVDGVEDLSKKL